MNRDREAESVAVVLSLGSNLGDSGQLLDTAITRLAEHPKIRVTDTSDRAVTSPVGGPEGQPDFLNQIVLADTELTPKDLLEFTQCLEAEAHRERTVRWGPRTLDIDIISYGDLTSDDPQLTLPHPRAGQRAFVLVPWSWVDPDAELAGNPIRELIEKLDDDSQEVRRCAK